jgi:hypothetical protein
MEDNQCTEFEYADGTTSECLSAIDIEQRGLRNCDTHVQVDSQTYCAGQEPRQAEVLGIPQGATAVDTPMAGPVLDPGILVAGAGLTAAALFAMSRTKKEVKKNGNR